MSDYTRNYHPGCVRYNVQVTDSDEIDVDQNQRGTPYDVTVSNWSLDYPAVTVRLEQDHLNTLAQILDELRTDRKM